MPYMPLARALDRVLLDDLAIYTTTSIESSARDQKLLWPSMSAAVEAAEEQEETITHGDHTIKVAASWRVGIGGKTWSTGALACKHLAAHADRYAALAPKRQLRVPGAPRGHAASRGLFAAKCLEARVVLTDAEDHLELLRDNVTRNNLGEAASPSNCSIGRTKQVGTSASAPDLILCTDNAYHPSLYEPLAAALNGASPGRQGPLRRDQDGHVPLPSSELPTAQGLDYRFAEAPADDYYALAICKAPAFDGRRDA